METPTGQQITVTKTNLPSTVIEQAIAKFPVALTDPQRQIVAQKVLELDFNTMSQIEISQVESKVASELAAINDTFLAGIDTVKDPRLEALYDKMGRDVEKAELGKIADRIIDGQLTLAEKLRSKLSKKAAIEVAKEAREGLRQMLAKNAGTLQPEIAKNKKELNLKMEELRNKMQKLEELNNAHYNKLGEFTVAAAVTRAFAEIGRAIADQAQSELDQTVNPGPEQMQQVETLKNKWRTAETRAVTKENALTRLPADCLLINQIIQAGITSYIDTLNMSEDEFNEITMTLIQLFGALQVKDAQDMQDTRRRLGENLASVRGKLVGAVTEKAASAAGDALIEQAQRTKDKVAQLANNQKAVNEAQKAFQQKTETAQKMLRESRQAMIDLMKKENSLQVG